MAASWSKIDLKGIPAIPSRNPMTSSSESGSQVSSSSHNGTTTAVDTGSRRMSFGNNSAMMQVA